MMHNAAGIALAKADDKDNVIVDCDDLKVALSLTVANENMKGALSAFL